MKPTQNEIHNVHSFRKAHQQPNDGFLTLELACEYARLYKESWGSNLVFLGVDEKDGYFFPGFNVFD